MRFLNSTWAAFSTLGSVLALAVGLNACAVMPAIGADGTDSWKEEVLLHDGQKLIVERSQTYGGRREVGQSPPVRELTIAFRLPGSGQRITWTSEYGEELGRTNFKLAALHILNDTPYLVALPNLCLSYNKWGRPNPPYVFFKYEGGVWKRIALEDFPAAFKDINLVVNNAGETDILTAQSLVTAEKVKELNGQLTQSEYRFILRVPMANGGSACEETFPNGKGRALGAGWFKYSKDLTACKKTCQTYEYGADACPCNKFFKEE